MSNEKPFQISVSDDKIDLLRRKVTLCVFPDELEDAGSNYGIPLTSMRRLVEYWKNGFDWRAQEAAINAELPQFTRDIKVDGFGTLNIHYVHQKSKAFDAIPLSFVLGCTLTFGDVSVLVLISR